MEKKIESIKLKINRENIEKAWQNLDPIIWHEKLSPYQDDLMRLKFALIHFDRDLNDLQKRFKKRILRKDKKLQSMKFFYKQLQKLQQKQKIAQKTEALKNNLELSFIV